MYNITREEAATLLSMSTRSIDRYIRSGKLRSKKEGKIVYIHQEDIDILTGKTKTQEVIIDIGHSQKSKPTHSNSTEISTSQDAENFLFVYHDLKNELKLKDDEIKKLNQEIGRMQEVVKNSISLIDYKKSHFLLEESKNGISQELHLVKKELEQKTREIQEERKLNYIMIGVTAVIFIMMLLLWFIKL